MCNLSRDRRSVHNVQRRLAPGSGHRLRPHCSSTSWLLRRLQRPTACKTSRGLLACQTYGTTTTRLWQTVLTARACALETSVVVVVQPQRHLWQVRCIFRHAQPIERAAQLLSKLPVLSLIHTPQPHLVAQRNRQRRAWTRPLPSPCATTVCTVDMVD